ncbi:hypothetical protein [Delftia sp. WSY_7]|uniref:hypothetical protein n=1 Tax=Delftia sp. WSY_7 TaxID=3367202 RepID=UPI00370B511C
MDHIQLVGQGMGYRLKAIQYIEDARIEKDYENSNLHNSGSAWFSNNIFANFLDGTNEN